MLLCLGGGGDFYSPWACVIVFGGGGIIQGPMGLCYCVWGGGDFISPWLVYCVWGGGGGCYKLHGLINESCLKLRKCPTSKIRLSAHGLVLLCLGVGVGGGGGGGL